MGFIKVQLRDLKLLHFGMVKHKNVLFFASFNEFKVYLKIIIYTILRLFYSVIYTIKVQSHPNTMRGLRRLPLAALTCLLADYRAIRLPLLPNTHCVISVYFPSKWSHTSTYICKAETLAFTDCDYC